MTTFSGRLKALHSQTPEQVAAILQFSGSDELSLTYDQLLRSQAEEG